MKIGFLYEHPDWCRSLMAAFSRAGVELVPIDVGELSFDVNRSEIPFDLALNRVNVMPSRGRSPSVVSHTLQYLSHLESLGVRIVNGSRAHRVGISKVMQSGIFRGLGLTCPDAVAVHRLQDIPGAADRIGFPLITKPNIGGSGAGIRRFDSKEELESAIRQQMIDLGIDGTALIQRWIPSDGFVHRVEILGDRLFYAIRQPIREDSFNYCATDGCSVPDGNPEEVTDHRAGPKEIRIQPFLPDDTVLEAARAVVTASGADLGGVEYLLEPSSGRVCFYDFNPYSNFVRDGESLLGFSPEERFVDFIIRLHSANAFLPLPDDQSVKA